MLDNTSDALISLRRKQKLTSTFRQESVARFYFVRLETYRMRLRWAALVVVLALSAVVSERLDAQQAGTGGRRTSPLGQNYPNPFNPETTIPFAVGDSASCASNPGHRYRVSLRIYNVLAQLVAIPILQAGTGSSPAGSMPVVNAELSCGSYTAYWDGKYRGTSREVASGVYIYQLSIDGKVFTRKMLVAK